MFQKIEFAETYQIGKFEVTRNYNILRKVCATMMRRSKILMVDLVLTMTITRSNFLWVDLM